MPRYNRIDVIASLPQHLLILSSFRHLCLLKQTFGMLYGYIRLIFSCIWQNTILQLSSNGNKKLTNVSQLFLNLSPHSLIYSSANMRQLLPTAVASLGNRIIELITCARWINGSVHGTSSARQFPSNGSLLQLPSSSNEKRAASNSFQHSFFDKIFIPSISFHEYWIVRGVKRVQTRSNIRSSIDVLRQNSYICNNTIITFIEWNSYMDDWKSKRDRWTNAIKQLLQLDILRQIRRTIDSLHQHRFHRHRTKLMEAEEGRIGGNDGGERSRQLSNVRTSS